MKQENSSERLTADLGQQAVENEPAAEKNTEEEKLAIKEPADWWQTQYYWRTGMRLFLIAALMKTNIAKPGWYSMNWIQPCRLKKYLSASMISRLEGQSRYCPFFNVWYSGRDEIIISLCYCEERQRTRIPPPHQVRGRDRFRNLRLSSEYVRLLPPAQGRGRNDKKVYGKSA